MKLVCINCGYQTEAEVHTENCPKCKSPMQIKKDKEGEKSFNTKDTKG